MVYDPNSTWSARADDRLQAPVYFLRIDGLTSKDYATAPVKNASRTKIVCLDVPRGLTVSLDPITGTRPIASVSVPMLDVDGEATKLIATEADGAPVGSLINRKAWIYGGYRDIDEADYAPIFGGRISGVSLMKPGRYELTISDPSRVLDGEIMSNATSEKPTTVKGNPVNLYWAILTGTFSTTHATFPLDEVSSAGTDSSAPTGLGIDSSEIDEDMLVAERDLWYKDDVVKVIFIAPESARTHLQREFFRVFQAWPVITQEGKIGLKFFAPPIPSADIEIVGTDDIVGLPKWRRQLENHLNKFVYYGNYSADADSYDSVLYDTEDQDDIDNQDETGETITFLVQSKWLRNDVSNEYGENGEDIAATLATRMRMRYLVTPAEVTISCPLSMTRIEEGDIIGLTHPMIPNLGTGKMGVSASIMLVASRAPDFERGLITFKLIDTGFSRYGLVAGASMPDYGSATDSQRGRYVFISDSSGKMSDGSLGYNMA